MYFLCNIYTCIHVDLCPIVYSVTSKRLKLPIYINNTFCTALQNTHLNFIRNSHMSLLPLKKLGLIFKFMKRILTISFQRMWSPSEVLVQKNTLYFINWRITHSLRCIQLEPWSINQLQVSFFHIPEPRCFLMNYRKQTPLYVFKRYTCTCNPRKIHALLNG